MIDNTVHLNVLNSPVRTLQAKVTLNDGTVFKHNTNLKGFNIERVGAGKFFGFGVCHKANIQVIDVNREIEVTTANSLDISFGEDVISPIFQVTEVNRDENTNELSITAYDSINKASNHLFSELELEVPYSMTDVVASITDFLGLNDFDITTDTNWQYAYETGANLEGTETLREVLDKIAEATQSIYYVNAANNLVYKKLDKDGDAVFTIDKNKYFTLESKTNRRLATIVHATELGDNISASTTESGSTQYIRNNPFWELREDIATLVTDAVTAMGGLTINQFNCEWRGNYLLEIGDKISLVTKDNNTVTSYLLNDTLTYNGTLAQTTEWSYEENEEETESTPTTIGDALKQTFAKVDKVNKQIDLVVSDVEANKESISALQLNTDSISASVSKVEEDLASTTEGVNEEIATLTQKVESVMTADEVSLQIKSELDNGVTKVETNTGFTFNDEGLTINKNDSEMKTTITEDGMTVYKNDEAVLVANNVGVEAKNLHATTYLIIGTNSRFEDYTNVDGDSRTGCFWIGS